MRYEEEALRTLSNEYHDELVCPSVFQNRLNAAIDAANFLDALKKTLFYGKDNGLGPGLGDERSLADLGKLTQEEIDFIHGAFGVFTEAGELLEHLRDVLFFGKRIDYTNINEENGDLQWYQAILARVGKTTFQEIQEKNIAKLRARYPEKFTEENALNRDLDTEREILER